MNTPRILSNQSAAASFTIAAKEISQGKNTTRVRLNNTDSTAQDVAAKTISKSFSDRIFAFFAVSSKKYVAVNIENQKVLLNVNSVAKRLHIAKEEVIGESKKDNFTETLSKKAEFTEKVLKNYNEILSTHFEPSMNRKEFLNKANDGAATPLTKETIMKVIYTTLTQELGGGIELNGGSKPIVARHQEEGRVDLHFIEKQIGTGGTANIFILGDDQVYKSAKSSEEISENKKEATIVNKLNENGPQDGISLPMHLVESLTKKGEYGILMPKYDHDYTAVCPTQDHPLPSLSHNELLVITSEFCKILSGLSYMHSQGILHGDIKPQNILQKEGRTDIIDFGEARDINTTNNFIPNGQTFSYTYSNDMDVRSEEKDPAKVIAIEKSRDVFATGTTFFQRFQEGTPFKIDQFFGRQEGFERNSLPDFVPKAFTTLIEGMTHPDMNKRLSAGDALIQLQTYQAKLNKLPELQEARKSYINEMNRLMSGNYHLGSQEKTKQEIKAIHAEISQLNEKIKSGIDVNANITKRQQLNLKRNRLIADVPHRLSEQEKVKIRIELERVKAGLATVNEEIRSIES